jgi:hypothetical protein
MLRELLELAIAAPGGVAGVLFGERLVTWIIRTYR